MTYSIQTNENYLFIFEDNPPPQTKSPFYKQRNRVYTLILKWQTTCHCSQFSPVPTSYTHALGEINKQINPYICHIYLQFNKITSCLWGLSLLLIKLLFWDAVNKFRMGFTLQSKLSLCSLCSERGGNSFLTIML